MTQQYNLIPTYDQPLTIKGALARGWYSFFSGLYSGQATGPVAAVTVGTSPYTYKAPVGGTLMVSGGTVTQISFSRDGANFFILGVTAGAIPMSQGDQVVLTYSVGPPVAQFVFR